MLGQEGGPSLFVIEVAEDAWSLLDADQRKALLDHELCHFCLEESEEGPPEMALLDHDVEEFVAIMERHGAWEPGRERLVAAANAHRERAKTKAS